MKLNENIKRIKNIIETSDKLNEMETRGNRTWLDDEEYDAYERVLNKMLSKKYSWWKHIDITYLTYDAKERKINLSGDLILNQDWVDSLDYDLELDDEEVTWLGDFLSPEDAFKIRDDFADSFSFVFGFYPDSIRYSVEVKLEETQDINEEIEDNQPKKDLSPLIRKLLQSIIDRNSDIICDIEVTAPWNRDGFSRYKIMIRFVGGPESNRWPKTMAIYDENDEIMNEIWSLVYDVIGEATDLYLTDEPRCEKNQNEEKTEDVHFKHLYNESELPKSKIDLVKELIKTSGLKTASDTLGGIDNLVKIAFDGDIMKYYEEMGFKPIRITDDGMNMYIDELIVNTFGLEPKGFGVFKNEINLGDFTWKSFGMNYRFTASLMSRIDSKTGQKSWRVVGISGDYGFGYGFINQRNTIGKRGRAQIFKQIIDKYNLGQFL